jgi:HlyD family secretion protein
MYQRFNELKNGARSEDIEQAQTQVQMSEASLAQLERDWNRQKTLYQDSAVSRAEVERAETNYLIGKRTLESTRSRLQQLKAGNRSEQIAQAEADYLAARTDVVSAEASLNGMRCSGEAQMKSLLASPRPEDVEVARQRLQQALRSRDVISQRLTEAATALTLARQRYSETKITAPFAGTVTQIVTEVGAVTGKDSAILRLVRTGEPEIRVDLDESNLGKLQIGQEALVTNDAFPDSKFKAKVSEIGAQVDTDRGTVEVRLKPISPPEWVRPGQTFTVNIVLGGAKQQLVVPPGSVISVGGVSSLLVVENGKIVKKSVKVAPMASRGIPVLQGLTPEAQVITETTGLLEGESVLVRNKQ